MEYLDVIIDSKDELIRIYEVLKKSGALSDIRVRSSLVEYSLINTINRLSTVLEDLSEWNIYNYSILNGLRKVAHIFVYFVSSKISALKTLLIW